LLVVQTEFFVISAKVFVSALFMVLLEFDILTKILFSCLLHKLRILCHTCESKFEELRSEISAKLKIMYSFDYAKLMKSK